MAATATAMAGFSKRNNADERDMAYIENELGKKPTKKVSPDYGYEEQRTL